MSKRPKNPFFQFKQFSVWHDRCGMKVCTEACVLGAYAHVTDARRVLDIGTGTGLLSLMVAQRNPSALVTAVELDGSAYQQAVENVTGSPFAARITVHQSSIQAFAANSVLQFDCIISNPPFFSNHLSSPHPQRQLALHTDTLPLSELATAVQHLLTPKGKFVVLLPVHETTLFTQEAVSRGLHLTHQLKMYQRTEKPLFRVISTFSKQATAIKTDTLYLHNADGYTNAFKALLKDFYLAL